ncbi:hypothetical protein Y032_0003g1311 [Ancylostoma ceylanicum]|uniref:Uncharacterized protein n=1 Tax=Ancylostoma ceylanicum TaxID=53326 RepID=A0A016VYT4_9BILA|nr:hypothetical protein Y032_0003g1311 [Ancylostoma ceylanicum]
MQAVTHFKPVVSAGFIECRGDDWSKLFSDSGYEAAGKLVPFRPPHRKARCHFHEHTISEKLLRALINHGLG